MLRQRRLAQFNLVCQCANRMLGFNQKAQDAQAALIGHRGKYCGCIGRMPQQIVMHVEGPWFDKHNRSVTGPGGVARAAMFGHVFCREVNIADFGRQGNRPCSREIPVF